MVDQLQRLVGDPELRLLIVSYNPGDGGGRRVARVVELNVTAYGRRSPGTAWDRSVAEGVVMLVLAL